jgi:protein gp37
MAENSKIQWTTHTFNPWRGCTKVSEGCKNCYAETMSGRNPGVLGEWGKNGTRVIAADAQWAEPVKWNRAAEAAGERHRVFCASLADVFEGPETMPNGMLRPRGDQYDGPPMLLPGLWHHPVANARRRLFETIAKTPHLDWLLLTKRPQNVPFLYGAYLHWLHEMGERPTADYPPNVWIGASVENQQRADQRLPYLCRIPAAVRFVSYEPALGFVDFRPYFGAGGIDWIIIGGESGAHARPFDPDWARLVRDQCRDAGVPVFVKQMGAAPIGLTVRGKGGEVDDIPADILVREFPSEVTA